MLVLGSLLLVLDWVNSDHITWTRVVLFTGPRGLPAGGGRCAGGGRDLGHTGGGPCALARGALAQVKGGWVKRWLRRRVESGEGVYFKRQTHNGFMFIFLPGGLCEVSLF